MGAGDWVSVTGDQCACTGVSAEAAREAIRRTVKTEELVDEFHFGVDLCRCERCGQRFVRVFTELIDWSRGDDSQAWMTLPIDEEEAAVLTRERGSRASLLGLSARRHLCEVFPRDGEMGVFWTEGPLVILPHD